MQNTIGGGRTSMHAMPPKHMQLQGMPSTNSSAGGWYAMGSARQPQPNFIPNSSGFPDEYAMGPGAGGNTRHRVFYEGRTMQKIPHGHLQEYGRNGMMPSQMHPNAFVENGMSQRNLSPNEMMLDASVPHQVRGPSGDQQMMQMNGLNNDPYPDQRMRCGSRAMYAQQYGACPPMQDPTMGPLDGVRAAPSMGPRLLMGSDLNQDPMICRMSGEPGMRASAHASRPTGYTHSSQQRVLPYPNPQQYMQNKRAQYNAKRRMHDADPMMMQSYGNNCYGNSWPRQQLSQQPLVSPNLQYAGVPGQVKEGSDLYLPAGHPLQNQCQLEQWQLSQMGREPVQCNNAFSPPPGNPTPPITPGSTSMPPTHLQLDQPEVMLSAPRSSRENEPYFTFAVREGTIKLPFQLEHNLPVSCHIFNLHDQTHESLMSRSDSELMLKCFHKEDPSMTTNWPATVSISLNEVPLLIDRGNALVPRHQPMFLKSICRPGQNALQISVKACCCSHLFVLQIVHRPSVRSVLHGLVSKRLLPATHAIAKIKRVMSQQQASCLTNEQQQFLLPLTCPISQQCILLPSRGQDCRHVQCFDLETYLKMNSEQSQWICPICKKTAALDGLEVDQYIWGILAQLSNTFFDAVVFDASANWKPVPKPGIDYGNDAILCKKFISFNTMVLPTGNMHVSNKPSSGNALPSSGIKQEPGSQRDCRQRSGSIEAPDYLGCLSQMTDVFLGSENSPNVPHSTNNLEHVSFPPTPMGSQISTICTPLDGQSLHPRTPSDGNTTHPHTPPDGHPFTPLDSQSVYSKTPSECYGSAGGTPRTPSAAYDSVGSNKQVVSTGGVSDGCIPVGSSISNPNVGVKMEIPAAQEQSQPSESSPTNDLTKLDFKSDLSMEPMFGLNDSSADMLSLVPDVFDDDPSDLTSYLGPDCKTAGDNSLALNRNVDDDFFEYLS